MKKLFFALAVSLSALTACTKSKDNPRDGFIGNYSIVITQSWDNVTVSTPNQTCSITTSTTGDANISLNNIFTSVITATVSNETTFDIPTQSAGTIYVSGAGAMDINKNISISYSINNGQYYNAILTRI